MLLAAWRFPAFLFPHGRNMRWWCNVGGLLPFVQQAGGDVFEAEFVERAAEDLAHFGFVPEEETA